MFSVMFGYLRRTIPVKDIVIVTLAVTMAVVAGVSSFNYLKKDVAIIDDGKLIHITTMENTVEDVFNHLGIQVKDYDFISTSIETELSAADNVINIKRAIPVNLYVDGKTQKHMTYMETVKDVINSIGIQIKSSDKLENVKLEDTVVSDMDIRIIRVKEEYVNEEEPIPFDKLEKPNNDLDKGTEKVVVAGEEGILVKEYKEIYEDGKLVSKDFLQESVLKNPIQKIVEYGTVNVTLSSRGDKVRYTKILEATATGYTADYKSTGKNPGDRNFGITSTGMKVREGVIAVDPKVIPLGTKVFITGGPFDYGFAIAADVGSAIKGNKIDLYFDTNDAAMKWGRRKVKIYVLKEQNDTRWKETDHVPGQHPAW